MRPDPADEVNLLLMEMKIILLAMAPPDANIPKSVVGGKRPPFDPPKPIQGAFMLWASSITIAVRFQC
jgi:hypothetical protein